MVCRFPTYNFKNAVLIELHLNNLNKKTSETIENEIQTQLEDVISTKNTCSLYKLKSTIDKCLNEKSIKNRKTILNAIQKLNNLIPSK